MEKISQNNIFNKPQYLHILNQLSYHPDGLTLHELTYKLTKKTNMYKLFELRKKLGDKREDIFRGRQRIQDCLYHLIKTEFVKKNNGKYVFNYAEMHLFLIRENTQKELFELLQSMRKEHEEIKQEMQNLDSNDNIQFHKLFNEAYGENFLKKYLTKHFNKIE